MLLYAVFSLTGLYAAVFISKKLELAPREKNLPAVIAALAGGVLGSQVPLWVSSGFGARGKSYLGALLGGFLAINLYKFFSGRGKESFGDNFAVGLALGAGFGKIGCFFNGCCGGASWGLSGLEQYPTQLIESAFNFAMAYVLYKMLRRGSGKNILFPFYTLNYLIMRFFIEFLRTEPVVLAGLTAYQLLALFFIPVFYLIIRSRKNVPSYAGA
ncbi:MAG: hypothetical protein COX65_03160 [Elusimicrobia bacterium CG_4_10_14_0_2_um_filter_56_8]|nr:MAG: hypothetical protein AUJ51_02465 [Elusimicrobia bacterium CG1_02_56_21]PJA16195.1 MAG: hypothetical protein COX65_03160 [Elusimicrobia bacterium CG_4_10_14_0_2_um_filter_56_8]